MLSNRRQQVQRQPVGMRHVAGDELHAAVHQVRDEGDIARQPIKLRDYQRRTMQAAHGQRRRQLRSVGLAARLHLHKFSHDGVTASGSEPLNGGALCLQAKTRGTLTGRRHA
ncbi:hypothetical protein MC45_14345 [Sphingomonas taxi]|uniref:Uncharacterized protein n=1 Tax=Sphingomonas taxi TaxID=1549858 RepID=A0A097EIG8_9SPHN|nr:hypothetical protein MC45_14345 [Sphingomonas taxi]